MQSTASYKGQRALIVGMGMSGRSAAHFLLVQGAIVQGIDRDPSLQSLGEIEDLQKLGMRVQHEQESLDVKDFDFIVLSPGVPPTHPVVKAAKAAQIEVVGEIELGCRMLKQPAIGITGTNGKTTVTLLVTHILKQSGYPAKALGNVGVPFTRELMALQAQETIILELSSYQLETMQQKILEQAVILNVTPDHLDRYASMEEYASAKFNIGRCLTHAGKLFVEDKAWQDYGSLLQHGEANRYGYDEACLVYTDLQSVFYGGRRVFDLPTLLRGKRSHDVENILAAYALCAGRVSGEQFLHALASFKKPSHRIEFVLEKKGVRYYDDSKGTNIDAVVRAVQSLEGPIILIAGGVDKGASYHPWVDAFRGRVKAIYAIGQAAEKMHRELSAHFPLKIAASLDLAVRQAADQAQEGETVLLSPGCSSFDMFKDYAHRGEEFQRIVRQL